MISDKPQSPLSKIDSPKVARWEAAAAGATIVWFLALMFWFVRSGRAVLDGDECALTLMGLHIRGGEPPPIFFYRQNYMGAVEGYLYAIWDALAPARSTFWAKAFAAMESVVYLLTSWALVRRFIGRRAALYALVIMAVPWPLLAVWYLKIRGYLPWLIVGNLVFYQCLKMREMLAAGRAAAMDAQLALLGFLLGLAFWINPFSVHYVFAVSVLILIWPEWRAYLMRGAFARTAGGGSWGAAAVNVGAVLAAAVLVSRSLLPERNVALLQWFFAHRALVLSACAALLIVHGVCRRLRPQWNTRPGLLALAFLVGNALNLWVTWTTQSLDLKPSFSPISVLLTRVATFPINFFPEIAGFIQLDDFTLAVFPVWANAILGALYVFAFYVLFRVGLRRHKAVQLLWLAAASALLGQLAIKGAIQFDSYRMALNVYLALAVALALAFEALDRAGRNVLGVVVLAAFLGAQIFALGRVPRNPITLPDCNLIWENELVDYCIRHDLKAVYTFGRRDGIADRLSFFSGERIYAIGADGAFCRLENHIEYFKKQRSFTVIALKRPYGAVLPRGDPDDEIGDFAIYLNVPPERVGALFPLAGGLPDENSEGEP